MPSQNALSIAHKMIQERVKQGNICIDATAGRGKDTAFLCQLVGENGKVLAFDIQPEAVESTKKRLTDMGLEQIGKVFQDSHSNMDQYVEEESVDCIVFNFGYLPGGDHSIYTTPETSIQAIQKGLKLLKKGGFMSLCVYYGGDSGYEEKNALMDFFKTIDFYQYTVLVTEFVNRPNDPPIPVFILKEA